MLPVAATAALNIKIRIRMHRLVKSRIGTAHCGVKPRKAKKFFAQQSALRATCKAAKAGAIASARARRYSISLW
jgi:hypothetical protein